jgi:hypothetical protein
MIDPRHMPGNGSVRLLPSRFKHAVLLAGSLAFTAGGIWMITSGEAKGWFVAGFFGLCALVAVIGLRPNTSMLVLEDHGFTVRSLNRSTTYRWEDVERFYVWTNPTSIFSKFVAMDLAPHAEPTTTAGRFMLKVGRGVGAEAILPDSYGYKVANLVELMEAWRCIDNDPHS